MHNEKLVTELLHLFNHLITDLHRLENLIMGTQAELAAQLNDLNTNLSNVVAQVAKVSTEVNNATQAQLDALAALQAIINDGNAVTPEVQAALDAVAATSLQLATSVQRLDDINPDAPVV